MYADIDGETQQNTTENSGRGIRERQSWRASESVWITELDGRVKKPPENRKHGTTLHYYCSVYILVRISCAEQTNISNLLESTVPFSLRLAISVCSFSFQLWTLWLTLSYTILFMYRRILIFFFKKGQTYKSMLYYDVSCQVYEKSIRKKSAPFHLYILNAFTVYWCKFINYIETNFALYVFKINSANILLHHWLDVFFYSVNGIAIPSLLIDLHHWRWKKTTALTEKQRQKNPDCWALSYRFFVVSTWANPVFIFQ